jgi:hypothetical protein
VSDPGLRWIAFVTRHYTAFGTAAGVIDLALLRLLPDRRFKESHADA